MFDENIVFNFSCKRSGEHASWATDFMSRLRQGQLHRSSTVTKASRYPRLGGRARTRAPTPPPLTMGDESPPHDSVKRVFVSGMRQDRLVEYLTEIQRQRGLDEIA